MRPSPVFYGWRGTLAFAVSGCFSGLTGGHAAASAIASAQRPPALALTLGDRVQGLPRLRPVTGSP